MKLENLKRHVVEIIVNCPLITDFSEYTEETFPDRKMLIEHIMSNFDIVETGFLQGDDKTIIHATDLVSDELLQGIHKVRGHLLIDIWKEACKKFKAHELKDMGRIIEETINVLKSKEGTKIMAATMKGMYEKKEPFVRFLGIGHLIQPVIKFSEQPGRLDQERRLIEHALISLVESESDIDAEKIKDHIKSIIHRSSYQENLCSLIQFNLAYEDRFYNIDPITRGVKVDKILDELPGCFKKKKEMEKQYSDKVVIEGDPKNEVTQKLAELFNVDINKVKPVQQEVKENKGMDKYLDIIKELHPELVQRQAKGEVLNEDVINKEVIKVAMVKMFGVNPTLLENLCNDPTCPVHSDKKLNLVQDLLKTKRPDGEELHEHQQRIVDLIIGIDPPLEGQISSPTATEIETTSNVVINQKFILNDVNGEFFCEYKMVWTESDTKFMFSHDKPGAEFGRRFYNISELTGKLSQDEAMKKFQSLRRTVISDGPHQPTPNRMVHGY